MPNIPNVPGVPALRSYAAASSIILLTSDAIRSLLGPLATRWGIFFNGIPVLSADNTISFQYKQDFSLPDYQTERGGFQSYNKVTLPRDIRMRFSAGGFELNRQIFIDSIDAVMNTTDLYDVVTPEKVYLGYNFMHCDYSRSAQDGVGLIVADLWLREIRETATATYQNTQQPGIAGRQGAGNVQPTTPNDRVSAAFTAGNYTVQ